MYFLDRQKLSIFRKLTASLRMMPDFMVIGAQKSGTTSLFMDLVRHPCIGEPVMKEVHYFDWANNLDRGLNWYKAHFPLKFQKFCLDFLKKRPFITGEASPDYMFYPHVPKRIAELMPNIKFIVMLRDPVDRAFSHYQHELRNGTESLSFEEAIRMDDQNLENEITKMNNEEHYCSDSYQSHTYLSRGKYWMQLQRWYRYFSKDQFLILSSDDYYNEPDREYKKITRFLGLPDYPLKHYRKSHKGNYEENMSPELRDTLTKFYEKHNKKLFENIGMKFS